MTRISAADVYRFLLAHFSVMIAANGFDPEKIGPGFDLLKEGVIDSLGILEMAAAVEQQFRIRVDFDLMEPADLTVLDKFSAFVAENAVDA